MRSGSEIKSDVEPGPRCALDFHANDIAAADKDGVITLTGFMRSHARKPSAGAQSAAGIFGMAGEIGTTPPLIHRGLGLQTALDAVQNVQPGLLFSSENVEVIVRSGWLALEREAEWNSHGEWRENFLRSARSVTGSTTVRSLAESAEAARNAWHAPGLVMVTSRIAVVPDISASMAARDPIRCRSRQKGWTR